MTKQNKAMQPPAKQAKLAKRRAAKRARKAMRVKMHPDLTRRGQLQLAGKQRGFGLNPLAQQMARAITMPSYSRPLRYPTVDQGTQKTAIWGLQGNYLLDYTGVSSANQTVLLTHSPVHPVWGWTSGLASRTYNFAGSNVAGQGGVIPDVALIGFTDNNVIQCYPGRYQDDPNLYVYIPVGTPFQVQATGWSGAGTITVGVSKMARDPSDPFDTKVAVTITAGSGVSTQPATGEGAWYAITSLNLSGGVTALAGSTMDLVIPANQTGMWPIMANPGLQTLSTTMDQIRMNAASLLLMNTSAALYKNGGVVAGRVQWGTTNVFTPSVLNAKLASINTSLKYTGSAKDGAYTYIVPDKASLEYSDYTTLPAGVNIPYVYDLGDFEHVNAVCFNVATDVTQRFTMQLRLDIHLEAITDSPVYNLDVASLSVNDFWAVLTSASSLVPFTENPTHPMLMAMVTKVLKRLAPTIVPYAHRGIDYLADRIAQL